MLKIQLKPNERIIIGDVVITNGPARSSFFVEGKTAILREAYIMRSEDVKTPCEVLYFLCQVMYLSKDPMQHHRAYFEQVQKVQEAAPSLTPLIFNANMAIAEGDYYEGLRRLKEVLRVEKEIISHADQSVQDGR